MLNPPERKVTLTVPRPDQDITVEIGMFKLKNLPGHLWSVIEAVDEDGNTVRLTQWESVQVCHRAVGGEDETGR